MVIPSGPTNCTLRGHRRIGGERRRDTSYARARPSNARSRMPSNPAPAAGSAAPPGTLQPATAPRDPTNTCRIASGVPPTYRSTRRARTGLRLDASGQPRIATARNRFNMAVSWPSDYHTMDRTGRHAESNFPHPTGLPRVLPRLAQAQSSGERDHCGENIPSEVYSSVYYRTFFGKSDRTPTMNSTRSIVILLLIGMWGTGPQMGPSVAHGQQANPTMLPDQPSRGQDKVPGPNHASPVGAQAVLEQAIIGVESLRSVSAQLRTVHVLDHQLVGFGTYFEQCTAKGLELRRTRFPIGGGEQEQADSGLFGPVLLDLSGQGPPKKD